MRQNICFLCDDRLATVTFLPCNHRFACAQCYQTLVNSRPDGTPNTCYCSALITSITDSTAVQAQEVTLEDGLATALALKTEIPFGAVVEGDHLPATEDLIHKVREEMLQVRAGTLTIHELKVRLFTRLTGMEKQIVFLELIKDKDLHDILRQIDAKQFETRTQTQYIRSVVTHVVESTDTTAIVARALVGAVGDTIISASTNGIQSLANFQWATDGVTNLLMFGVFTLIEVVAWKDHGDTTKLLTNIGEHAVGTGAGYVGAYAGASVGSVGGAAAAALLGASTALGGVVGALIGIIAVGITCDTAGRWIYRKVFPRTEETVVNEEVNVEVRLSDGEIAKTASTKFGVDIHLHSKSEAHARFRKALNRYHTDKHPNATEEERARLNAETIQILACWQIVRQYYNDHEDDDEDEIEEGFIKLNVLKMKNAATQGWEIVRTWFGDVDLGRQVDGDVELLDQAMLYL